MRAFPTRTLLALLAAAAASCSPPALRPGSPTAAIDIDGALFQVSDAAVYSNCLSLAFAVRGFEPPAGVDPQAFFPPARAIDVQATTPDGPLAAMALGGGGGGGGDKEDGRIWMEQRALFSLAQQVAEGAEVDLDIAVTLDEDFGQSQPLRYQITVVSGPGGGTCP